MVSVIPMLLVVIVFIALVPDMVGKVLPAAVGITEQFTKQ